MKGIIFGFDGHELNTIHMVRGTWDNALQEALDRGPLFDQALILDLDHSCPPSIYEQAAACHDGAPGHAEPWPIEIIVTTNLDEANAKLPARHFTPLQSTA